MTSPTFSSSSRITIPFLPWLSTRNFSRSEPLQRESHSSDQHPFLEAKREEETKELTISEPFHPATDFAPNRSVTHRISGIDTNTCSICIIRATSSPKEKEEKEVSDGEANKESKRRGRHDSLRARSFRAQMVLSNALGVSEENRSTKKRLIKYSPARSRTRGSF